MKPVILFLLLIPYAAIGQKFTISEQAGYSFSTRIHDSYSYGYKLSGPTNQVSVICQTSKHFAFGLFHEINLWNNPPNDFATYGPGEVPVLAKNYSIGGILDYTSKYFFIGANLQSAKFATVFIGQAPADHMDYKYRGSLCYGLHLGAKQSLSRHFQLTENVGYSWFQISGTNYYTYTGSYLAPHSGTYTATDPIQVDQSFQVFYLRLGLSYSFGEFKTHKSGKAQMLIK